MSMAQLQTTRRVLGDPVVPLQSTPAEQPLVADKDPVDERVAPTAAAAPAEASSASLTWCIPIVGGVMQSWLGVKENKVAKTTQEKVNAYSDMALGVLASGNYVGSAPSFSLGLLHYSRHTAAFTDPLSAWCNVAFAVVDCSRDIANGVWNKQPIQALYVALKAGSVALGAWGAFNESPAALWGCEGLYLATAMVQNRALLMAGVRQGAAHLQQAVAPLAEHLGWTHKSLSITRP